MPTSSFTEVAKSLSRICCLKKVSVCKLVSSDNGALIVLFATLANKSAAKVLRQLTICALYSRFWQILTVTACSMTDFPYFPLISKVGHFCLNFLYRSTRLHGVLAQTVELNSDATIPDLLLECQYCNHLVEASVCSPVTWYRSPILIGMLEPVSCFWSGLGACGEVGRIWTSYCQTLNLLLSERPQTLLSRHVPWCQPSWSGLSRSWCSPPDHEPLVHLQD